MRKIFTKPVGQVIVIAGASFALGALFQGILSRENFWLGTFAGGLLLFLIGGVLWLAWRKAGGGKALGWMILAAIFLRLALGVFLAWGLPLFGYDEKPQKAGFVFEDAYRRDENAWALAQSGQPLTKAFSDEYTTDQYGGMLALSALVYRVFSLDRYRPWLISILSAGAMALSLPFLFLTVQRQFSQRTALWSGWIFALYPEGILLGSSQMREPFYILFLTVIFWAGANWLARKKIKLSLAAFILSVICYFLFSYRVALPVLGVVLLWIWVVESGRLKKFWLKAAGWAAIGLGMVALLMTFWVWVDSVVNWDTLVTIRLSGMLQFQLESIPESLHLPLVTLYGLFQPVLPAALVTPAPWIWRVLGVFRAVGWYAILPIIMYVLIRMWKSSLRNNRWLILMACVVCAWFIIASMRAGGDQWDNPRYRTLFLPWIALLCGWGFQFALEKKDRWLTRIFIIEGIFLAFFIEWYFSRYWSDIPRFGLPVMVLIILVLSLAVVLGGILWDRKHPNRALTAGEEKL